MLLKKCLLALAIGGVLSASTVLVPDYIGSFSSVYAKDGGSGGGDKNFNRMEAARKVSMEA
ncbi:hypothetical protein CRX42_33460, partial [Pseudomonas jessenii]